MSTAVRKIVAIVEVTLVTFVIVPYLAVGIYRLFPHFEAWQTDGLGFPVPVFIYVVEAGLSIIVILLHRRKLADYGIHFHELK